MPFEHLKSVEAIDRLIKQSEQSYKGWAEAKLAEFKRQLKSEAT